MKSHEVFEKGLLDDEHDRCTVRGVRAFTISFCDELVSLDCEVPALDRGVGLGSGGADGAVLGRVTAHLEAADTIGMVRILVEKSLGVGEGLTITVGTLARTLVADVGVQLALEKCKDFSAACRREIVVTVGEERFVGVEYVGPVVRRESRGHELVY